MKSRLTRLLEKESPSKGRYIACALRWLKNNGFVITDPYPAWWNWPVKPIPQEEAK